MSSVVLASSNPGKIREIQAILPNWRLIPQSEFKIVDPEETGCTFVENALIKARNAAQHCNLPSIADDSGLVIDGLDGAPGVRSARYAGIGASDQDNLDKVLLEIQAVPEAKRTARFICVIVYMRHALDPAPVIAEGVWEGRIINQALGGNGFGYDPIFWVDDYQCTSAQLQSEQKNAISHRSLALRALNQKLNKL